MSTSQPRLQTLTDDLKQQIDHWIAKYPADKKRSAVLSALTLTQQANGGWLTEDLVKQVADYLDMSVIEAFEVATFYSMFDLKPVGRYKLEVCTNIACHLCGSGELVDHLQQRLQIKLGETTADGRYTLRSVECLAACINAPAMMINEDYHENLTIEAVDHLLDGLDQS